MRNEEHGPKSNYQRDVEKMEELLKEGGISEYEPRVLDQLLDIAFSTTLELLDGGKRIAVNTGKPLIDKPDINLSARYTNILPDTSDDFNRLLRLATFKNKKDIPKIRDRPHAIIKLPPERYCLLQQNVEYINPNPAKKAAIDEPIVEGTLTEPIQVHYSRDND